MPKTAAPSQCAAVALQNATCPLVTGENCPVTVAVSVTAVPAVTLLGDTLSVVVVGLVLPCASDDEPKTNAREIKIAARVLRLTMSVHTCFKQRSIESSRMRGFSGELFPSPSEANGLPVSAGEN